MLLSRRVFPAVRGHIQRLCEHAGVLRIGGPMGSPCHWSCTVHFRSPSEVELMGVDKKITATDRRDIRATLQRYGISVVHVLRRRHGRKDHEKHVTR